MQPNQNPKPACLADLSSLPGADRLTVEITNDLKEAMERGFAKGLGAGGMMLFGTAFKQGDRLCFTSAMSFPELLMVCKRDRAGKGSNLLELSQHSNRPKDESHARKLREYLMTTAVRGEKFILPSFTLSYGADARGHEDSPPASLTLYAPNEAALWWPAMLFLPRTNGGCCEITDGAHREGELEFLLMRGKLDNEQRERLANNAADVRIVFETELSQQHQDFADCGKAKEIAGSLVTTWDIRDKCNARSVKLVKSVPFLAANVDTTASNVNLSSKSRKIWSMSAVRNFINYIANRHPAAEAKILTDDSLCEKVTVGAEEYINYLVEEIPALKALNGGSTPEVTVPLLRDKLGGNIALRGVGMAMFARGFVHACKNGHDFAMVAKRLGNVDWHLLNKERKDLPEGEAYYAELQAAVLPHWRSLLAIGPNRYRISSSGLDADAAWQLILAEHFAMPHMAAAD